MGNYKEFKKDNQNYLTKYFKAISDPACYPSGFNEYINFTYKPK